MKPLKQKHVVEWARTVSMAATDVVLDGQLGHAESQTVMMIC